MEGFSSFMTFLKVVNFDLNPAELTPKNRIVLEIFFVLFLFLLFFFFLNLIFFLAVIFILSIFLKGVRDFLWHSEKPN